ncbi:MAG: thioredoxin [Agathobacter sp.]|nr:thioredoxin [Agathobacter sp.]
MITEEKRLSPYRNAILVVAIILVVYGFLNGGTIDVLAKAINICTECIGLG